jgi:hypothetical protein
MVAAHRGAHHFHPENSLNGISKAAALGAGLSEIDVRGTSDNILVLMHDSTVNRTTYGTGNVSDLTLEAIRALRLKGTVASDLKDWQVPTFKEALALAKDLDIVLYVDQKTSDTAAVTAAIEEAEAWEWALVRDDWPVVVAQAIAEPRLRVLPAIDTLEAFDKVLEVLPDVRIVEIPGGDVNTELTGAIRDKGVKVQQDVMGSGDVLAGFGDYSLWGDALRAGVSVPQTDWPEVLVPLVDTFNRDGTLPD